MEQKEDASTSQASLKALIHKRAAIKRIIANIKSQIDKVASTNQLMERLKSCHDNFIEIQVQMDAINDKEDEKEWDLFFNTYNAITNELEALTVSNQTIIKKNNVESSLRLPTIELPKFSGNFDEWCSFYETFTGLIHNNDELLTIQKFHFLKSALQGEAANIIYGMDVTENNYNEAWKLLIERYHNTRIIIQKHIRALFDLPQYSKDLASFLRNLHDSVNKHLRALKSLGQPVHNWDSLLIYLISCKLDNTTTKDWELTLTTKDMPTLKNLMDFINKKSISLQMANKVQINTKPPIYTKEKRFTHAGIASANNKCILCSEEHAIFLCKKFINFSIEKRRDIVKEHDLCFNCLKRGHRACYCKSSKCKKCHQNHNTLLHMEQKPNNEIEEHKEKISSNTCMSGTATNYILLATAQINLKNKYNKFATCTALLDSGSQSSLITKSFASKLGLPQKGSSVSLSGITGAIETVNKSLDLKISADQGKFDAKLNCLIVDRITERLPQVTLNKEVIKIPQNIKLADPNFHITKDIDLLIGADLFWKTLKKGRIDINQITFSETVFGWILSGNLPEMPKSHRICNHSTTNFDLEKFWKIEDIATNNKIQTINDKRIENNFQRNFKRNIDGRFIVKLPLKYDNIQLGDSFQQALKRFYNLEAKLHKDKNLLNEYTKFMCEYRELGHMKEITEKGYLQERPHFYLPHHAVIKCESLTTKLRVVFDGSATSSNGLSLNDNLENGPTIQDDLFNILLRFRTKKYVVSADITKMYRQVLIDEDQHKLQRILWRDNKTERVKTYELQTVTYGTTSAAYLAIRCMHQLASEAKEKQSIGANRITKDFYVDDLLTGASTITEVKGIRNEIIDILQRGGFQLRKWCSNDHRIIEDIKEDSSFSVISFDKNDTMKTLGLQWNFKQDILYYTSPKESQAKIVTKRSILSSIAKIFDPLGLIGPLTIQGKMIIQELWKCNIGWDDYVAEDVLSLWHKYIKNWNTIEEIQIPRLAGLINKESEIHGFCDASTRAYGACLYLRIKRSDGEYDTNLICAKAKVAPIKAQSLPRLELCGALLLARLMNAFEEAIEENHGKIIFWTDSKIVLSWIKASNKRFKTFVANRVGEIQETTNKDDWHHVKGTYNPADVISRGMALDDLKSCSLWWNGPQWLRYTIEYPSYKSTEIEEELHEIESTKLSLSIQKQDDLILKFSNWKRLIRVTAYCVRFWKNLRAKKNKASMDKAKHIRPKEFNDARRRIIAALQREEFAADLKELKRNKCVANNSGIANLRPFLDADDIIRVGGRLSNANLDHDAKHPIVLPRSHHVTKIIIRHYHEENLHAGMQTTLNAIRQDYWPIRGSNTIKGVLRQCVRCFKHKPRTFTHIMGDLPAARVNKTRPFANTGVDFCGPFYIRSSNRRNAPTIKVYIAIFVCFAIKAVHMEIVEDLKTETFIAAYKRFVSRRGKPENMFSDNGTTFVSANKELKHLQDMFNAENSKLSDYMVNTGTRWHFIPPRAPHFGGLWEAAVKSAKTHFKKLTANSKLRHDEFQTVITQVEAVLNSRPLTSISSDPSDLNPLTPFHFLIGSSFNGIQEPSLEPLKLNTLSRWQYVENIKQQFWKRWTKEYLNKLQARTRWTKNDVNKGIKPGQLVLVKEDHISSYQWPLGRITEIHPGEDDITRVVSVKTRTGVYKRPTLKVCPLPIVNCD